MPILEREPDTFPESLLDEGGSAFNALRPWWALYSLPRHEKQLVRKLRLAGLAHYCPFVSKRYRSPAGRIRVSHVPLFAGYVFLCGDGEERGRALATNCVSRVLEVPCAADLVEDLRRIRRLVCSNAALTVESRLKPGSRVRVRSGAFAGYEGTILQRQGQTRLIVSVRFLQQGASVELDDCQLEPLA